MILALALQVVAAGQSFTCTPVRVWDGDGPDLLRFQSSFRNRRTTRIPRQAFGETGIVN